MCSLWNESVDVATFRQVRSSPSLFGIYFWIFNDVRVLVIVGLLGKTPLVSSFGLLLAFCVLHVVRIRHVYLLTKAGEKIDGCMAFLDRPDVGDSDHCCDLQA